MMVRSILFISIFLLGTSPVQAQSLTRVDIKTILLCEGQVANNQTPTFSETSCKELDISQINPGNTLIWLKAIVDVPQELMASNKPLGLFISGKAASTFYLNGKFLGNNGFPAQNLEHEIPGRMDQVIYLPSELLKEGQNEFYIHMSGHSSLINLEPAIQRLEIGLFDEPAHIVLDGYLPSFLPLGILIVGAFYFGALALRRKTEIKMIFVPLAALFVVGQFLAEVSRGLFPYDYPFHDIRMLLILLFAAATGACLLFHVFNLFVKRHTLIAAGIFVLAMIPVFFAETFDEKSLLAIVMPAISAALISLYSATQKKPKAIQYAIVLFLFSIIVYQVPHQFLDVYFYYIVAGLLLFLFGHQIHIFSKEKELRVGEQARADRLQLILDAGKEKSSPSNIRIKVSQLGKVDLIPTNELLICKGARDYVELLVKGGRSILHKDSLFELEKELPATFLRVHRSYIVNTAFIKSLEREPSGSGKLVLTTGDSVPVSRRIMPKVRKALG